MPVTATSRENRSATKRVTAAAPLRETLSGFRGDVRFEMPLRELTSFRIGGPADAVVWPADVEDLRRLMRQARAAHIPLFVIGGTNLLVRDGGIRGIVVSLAKLRRIIDEPNDVLYAEAGVTMPILLQHSISRSLSGLEWSAGIPGTVGGCVVMNAGTRLGEMKDALKAIHLVTPTGTIKEIATDALRFSYRRAHLPRGIVVGAWLQLRSAPKERIQRVVKDYLRYRKDTQPLTIPNAGCAFKNAGSEPAGRLIEAAGLKGARIGDAQVSEKHGNFIVNRGAATAADVLALIRKVRRVVRQKTGVTLELELKVVGEP